MAEPRQALVKSRHGLAGPSTLLRLQIDGAEAVTVRGGQYVIINTGRHNAEGKLIKRAYTLFGVEPCGREFLLAAQPVNSGIASQYLAELSDGDRLIFSGPWGKFYWPAGAEETQVIALAFGSGITAVLGYLQSVPEAVSIRLCWYTGQDDEWLQSQWVRNLLARDGLIFETKASWGDLPENSLLLSEQAISQTRYVLAGEGTGVDAWQKALLEHSVPASRIQSEIFYRRPENQI